MLFADNNLYNTNYYIRGFRCYSTETVLLRTSVIEPTIHELHERPVFYPTATIFGTIGQEESRDVSCSTTARSGLGKKIGVRLSLGRLSRR